MTVRTGLNGEISATRFEGSDMTNYDPNNRRRPAGTDNSGAWIVGIIVLIAIGIGVWWWAGWTGGERPVATTAPTSAPATTGAAPGSTATTPPAGGENTGAGSASPGSSNGANGGNAGSAGSNAPSSNSGAQSSPNTPKP
jgi:hypothetical protein